jgi:serine O-acetyltransferase
LEQTEQLQNNLGLTIFENTDFYAVFLAYLGQYLAHFGERKTGWRVFALNKMLHGLNISPNVRLPTKFRIAHGVGTVIGQAILGNRLFVTQGCTIGASTSAEYPTLDTGVSMMANSAILGRCCIGSNVVIGAGVHIINCDVPSDTLVINEGAGIKFVQSKYPMRYSARLFGLEQWE